jgi:HSP20 family protein
MAMIQRYNPVWVNNSFDETFDRLWQVIGNRPRTLPKNTQSSVPLDVMDTAEHLMVTASLPGFECKDICVDVEDRILTIKADIDDAAEDGASGTSYLLQERNAGPVVRSLRLPKGLNTEKGTSEFRNGVLSVTLPKSETTKPKQIEIKAGT